MTRGLILCTLLFMFINVSLSSINSNSTLRFLVVGDMGGLPFLPYTTPIEFGVAKQMAVMTETSPADFILALGDNFYFHGVKDVSDRRFQESFERIFDYPSLYVPWYVVAGNHDHLGNVSAEIYYSNVSKRWNFPHLYYPLSLPIPGTTATVDILMLDTITLCGNTGSDFLDYPVPSDLDVQSSEEQWSWIEKSLANNKARYLLVAGHFPVYSIAEHGPTSCLVDRLLPMLYKYKVNAYLCGHDHNLQHLQSTDGNVTVDFFVSGASNFIDPSRKHAGDIQPAISRFHWASLLSLGGFGAVEVNTNNMTFSFIEVGGEVLYQWSIKPRDV